MNISVQVVQDAKINPKRSTTIVTDLQRVNSTCKKMQNMLTSVRQYVDDVLVSAYRHIG